MQFRSCKGRHVLKALNRIGWLLNRQNGTSHKILFKGNARYMFHFNDNEEIGPKMLAKISKDTGLTPKDV